MIESISECNVLQNLPNYFEIYSDDDTKYIDHTKLKHSRNHSSHDNPCIK